MGEGYTGALVANCTGPGTGSLRLSPVKSQDFWALAVHQFYERVHGHVLRCVVGEKIPRLNHPPGHVLVGDVFLYLRTRLSPGEDPDDELIHDPGRLVRP